MACSLTHRIVLSGLLKSSSGIGLQRLEQRALTLRPARKDLRRHNQQPHLRPRPRAYSTGRTYAHDDGEQWQTDPNAKERRRRAYVEYMAENEADKTQAPIVNTSQELLRRTPEKPNKSEKQQPKEREIEPWRVRKEAVKRKLNGASWDPKKKVSPDAMEGIRAMNAEHPEHFTTEVLSVQFGLSPEAVRRILKSKWRPNEATEEDRRQRWDRRGERIWTDLAEAGVRPPKKWRSMGIGGGPRRPAQDRKLQRAIREGKVDATGRRIPEADSWLSSLAGRIS